MPTLGTKRSPRNRAAKTPSPGLADALFAKVQQRVLAVLFGDPGRSFHANEIIHMAGSGSGAVQRELARLEASGLATVARIGKRKHSQATRSAPSARGVGTSRSTERTGAR